MEVIMKKRFAVLMLAAVMIAVSFSAVSFSAVSAARSLEDLSCHGEAYCGVQCRLDYVFTEPDNVFRPGNFRRFSATTRPRPEPRCHVAAHLAQVSDISYEMAAEMLASPAILQFNEFFGSGAAHNTLMGQNFRHLAVLLGEDLVHEIIEVKNLADWLESILGAPAMDDLKSLYIWHPYANPLRFSHFYDYYLPQIVDSVRWELVQQGIIEILDLSLSHEETLLRGFKIIDGNIHDRYGNLFLALDENGRTAWGTWLSANFIIGYCGIEYYD
jgi:hypothetical protein